MLTQETQNIIDNVSDIAIEGLKFIPAGEVEEALKQVQSKIAGANFDGTTGNPVKIVHSAINIGVELSKHTETTKDDLLFAKADALLDKYEENGNNIIGAILAALFKRVKKA